MTQTATSQHQFLATFRELERELAARGPRWLRRSRKHNLSRFSQLGFPSTREEDWRNTNVEPIARTSFRPAVSRPLAPSAVPRLARLDLGGPVLAFVNGHFSAQLSSPGKLRDGAWVGSLARALEERPERLRDVLTRAASEELPAFRALNSALAQDGGVVWIPRGCVVEQPIQLIYVTGGDGDAREPTAAHPRTLVIAEESSQATVVESYLSSAASVYLTNAVTELKLGQAAVLDHVRVQLESEQAYHVATVESRQAANSRYRSRHVNLGGRLVRNDIRAVLDGPGANCDLDGLYLTRGLQHVDNHTVLDHAKPHCDSRELFKGILGGKSRTVFNGRIIVRPAAQRTDAKQSNPNLLLSPDALAQTRPQLEIYADDVKCTHGATVGRLDEDALFYLRSRAIGAQQARNLLIEAFAGEVLEQISIEPLSEELGSLIDERLASI